MQNSPRIKLLNEQPSVQKVEQGKGTRNKYKPSFLARKSQQKQKALVKSLISSEWSIALFIFIPFIDC